MNSVWETTKIVNVVVSAKLDHEIDIKKVARRFQQVVYEPESFSGLIYRRINPTSTIVMFSSGRITSIGTKTEEAGRQCLHTTTFELEKLMRKKIGINKIKTVNVVAIGDFGQNVDLLKFAEFPKVQYIPEQFPGAIINLPVGKCLVFSTGKIISVGCKNEKDAKTNIQEIYYLLKQQGLLVDSVSLILKKMH